jgi:tRNA threonylcarbamoyladenosine modification (KEOPS) complex  Pcc1 subunit
MISNLKSYKARIRISTKSKDIAASVSKALEPDLRFIPATQCVAEMYLENTEILFKINASDIASLRAIVNSHVRLADVSYRCLTL